MNPELIFEKILKGDKTIDFNHGILFFERFRFALVLNSISMVSFILKMYQDVSF